ncbi:Hypothetical predicted protein [Mytilus galloprovincialis]|uniref:Uncharacterized protein n=1 Tax=Mytilus galloprovincialis TaxID=29158 RepID=A0A8B6HIL9_MYTGA|nr:Hypothetical predicted protein [Mytilus galloprovincialis]
MYKTQNHFFICLTENVCDLVSCSNHGNCTTSGDCVCDKNWSGKDCSKEVNEDFCIGKASGHYAHPTDCTAYYVCHADTERTALLYCGPGTLWSQSLKVCADPAITKVECFEGVGNYSNGNTTQSVCSTIQNGHLPNPEDCSSFIQCANGVAHIMPCPLGLHWNPNILNCDFPENVEPRCSTLQGSQATENPCDIDTCNGNGICVVVNGAAVCNCFQGWLTDNCSEHVCDNATVCSERGKCNRTTGECQCEIPWAGANCEVCNASKAVDVAFILDETGSISDAQFQQTKQAIFDTINILTVAKI